MPDQKTYARFIDPKILSACVMAGDFLLLFSSPYFLLSSFSSFELSFSRLLGMPEHVIRGEFLLGLLFGVLTSLSIRLLKIFGGYRVSFLARPFWAVLGACSFWGSFLFLEQHVMARFDGGFFLLSWRGMLLLGCLFFVRWIEALWLQKQKKQGAFCRKIVILGSGPSAAHAIETLQVSWHEEHEILGFFSDQGEKEIPDHLSGIPKLGSFFDLPSYVRQAHGVDLVLIALPVLSERRFLEIFSHLWILPIDIRISVSNRNMRFFSKPLRYLGMLPVLAIFDRPLSPWGGFFKGLLDYLLAALLVIVLSPIFLMIALAVHLETPGPVLFRQKRYGFNNDFIEIYKFRSMYVDQQDFHAERLVTQQDPRVTRVGRFLRKTSLDELPQLFNVLEGKLSLVGPRPHALKAKAGGILYEKAVQNYFARHKLKPGMTGWAQINGWRGETDTVEKLERRIQHDLEYIDHWSFFLDLWILLRTPFALLDMKKSY